jgi:hypothetical protein
MKFCLEFSCTVLPHYLRFQSSHNSETGTYLAQIASAACKSLTFKTVGNQFEIRKCRKMLHFFILHQGIDKPVEILTGDVLMFRNPCLHPGDLRLVRAVDLPELSGYANIVLLPATKHCSTSLADECSGGDLVIFMILFFNVLKFCCQFHQRFFARFFRTNVLFGSFSSYVLALAPKFVRKTRA